MTTLPVSLLWLFMVCFTCGQILDTASVGNSFTKTGGFGALDNSTGILFDDDQNNGNQNVSNEKLETKKEEEQKFDHGSVSDGDSNKSQNEMANKKPNILVEKPATSTETPLTSDRPITGRGKRKFATQRTSTTAMLSGIPSMSPERRNSYLSIAERRKYYNKTQGPTKKPEITETELDHQETVNKFVTSSLSSAASDNNHQINEIPVSRKPAVKELGRSSFVGVIGNDKRNQTNFLKLLPPPPTSFPLSEKIKKIQNTRQSVIQSQYEFGQKLNSKKTVLRVQPEEQAEEKLKKNTEKITVEPVIETTTTFRLLKSSPVQSTELLRVNKNFWTTTFVPEFLDDEYNSTGYTNTTDEAAEMAEYVTINRTQGAATAAVSVTADASADSTTNSSFILESNKISDGIGSRRRLESIKLAPFPLNYANLSSGKSNPVDNEEEVRQLATNIKNVYNQEILRINATTKTVKIPLSLLKSFSKNSRVNSGQSQINANTTRTVESFTEVPSSKLSNDESPSSELNPPYVTTLNTNPMKSNETTSPKTAGQSNEYFPNSNIHPVINSSTSQSSKSNRSHTKNSDVSSEMPKNIASSPPFINLSHYPTIELNENNKRILSEMFNRSSTTVPTTVEKQATTTTTTAASKTTKAINTTDATTTSTTTITTADNSRKSFIFDKTVDNGIPETTANTTESSDFPADVPKVQATTKATTMVSTNEDSVNLQYPDEDRKAMGTRYNTKFYISPNASKTQQKVIKVIEAEDEDEEDQQRDDGEVTLMARPVGITAYVLAAFGIVPLLLAAVFAAKFVIDRHQRRYDCESDEKSDSISTSECQTRLSKRKKTSGDLKKSPSNVTTTTLVTASRLPRVHHHWINCDKQGNKNWEIPRSRLKMRTILGQGNFGQVWKAEVEDVAGHDNMTRLVAVKTVKEGAGEKEHKEFIKELEIMQQIGSHPNIVTLLGCCTDQEPYYLIMEYVKYGKLLTYLREHRVNENYHNFSNNEDALTSKDLTVFAYCISQGMEYLVSRGIIHRDLAARNVLVDHNKVCKIADFGMSRSVRNFEDGQVYEERQHKGALPIRWMAPESLVYSVFTHKSDVWSFGIVMWEIVTLGSIPYPNMGAREIMRRVRDGYRLERPGHCKPELYRLMSHCWTHDPNKRPDFSELREDLSNLLENPSKDGSYVDLDRFAVDNGYHISGKSRDSRLLERKDCRAVKRLGDWDTDWQDETKRPKIKKGKNNGKGTVTLTGQGSFTVNSRILEKEFKMI